MTFRCVARSGFGSDGEPGLLAGAVLPLGDPAGISHEPPEELNEP